MSQIVFDPDPEHALSFDRDLHYMIGHLLAFKVGVTMLTPDLRVLEPMGHTNVTVVGLINKIVWDGGPADKIEIVAMISSVNRQRIMTFCHTKKTAVTGSFKMSCYDYDDSKLKFYKALETDSDISCKIATTAPDSRGDVDLELGMSPTAYVISTTGGGAATPTLWEMTVKVESTATIQTIQYQTGHLQRIAKKWGVPVT